MGTRGHNQKGAGVSPENRKATPGQPGSAYCPRCGRSEVPTYMERGEEKYAPHARKGSVVTCYTGSNQPVAPPREAR